MFSSICIKFASYPIMHVVLNFHLLFSFVDVTVIFQVFQLTLLVIRGPKIFGENFIISLGRVAIKQEERGVLLCVQEPRTLPKVVFSRSLA